MYGRCSVGTMQQSYPEEATSVDRRAVVLAGAFTLTGVGTGILGASLPAMLHQWQLSDDRGGLLLFLSWAGSMSGAMLCGQRLQRSVVRGLVLSGAALAVLAYAKLPLALACFFPYGVGLGIAMTSISVLRGNEVSDAQRPRELNRLNMLWALGACVSPSLAVRALASRDTGGLFAVLAGVLIVVGGLLWVMKERDPDLDRGVPCRNTVAPPKSGAIPLMLCLMAALPVGVESSLGGWLTTYAGRVHHGEAIAISGTTAFWAGLLASRALHSLPGMRVLRRAASMSGHMLLVLLAVAGLLLAPGGVLYPVWGLLAGFGLGPLYPFVLSVVLGKHTSRVIFLSAGIGAALLPWATGAVSHSYGSLRVGLCVPLAGALALVVIAAAAKHKWVDAVAE